MPTTRVNDVQIFYEEDGEGEPLVLVHGSWGDHNEWQEIVPLLAPTFRVVAYDRRGHGESEHPSGAGSRREDEDDLAALIEALHCAPAHLAGNSFGASIVLALTARRPDLVHSTVAHEPPLLASVSADPKVRPLLDQNRQTLRSVLDQLSRGDFESGFRHFVEDVALGPGAWQQLPEELRQRYASNAPTFLDEQQDSQWDSLNLGALSAVPTPVLLTDGEQSPPLLRAVVQQLDRDLPRVQAQTVPNAGHLPHVTAPDTYASMICRFVTASH